jgi:hypothetical protein
MSSSGDTKSQMNESMLSQMRVEYMKTATPQTMLIDGLIVFSLLAGASQVNLPFPTDKCIIFPF